jgi:small subunit ribosomal protein S7
LGKEIKRNELIGMKVSPQGPIPLLTILQNKLMRDGRKGPAEKVFFRALRELNEYSNEKSGVTLFYTALERLKPALTTVTRRVGRNYYQVPVPLRSFTPYKLAFQ